VPCCGHKSSSSSGKKRLVIGFLTALFESTSDILIGFPTALCESTSDIQQYVAFVYTTFDRYLCLGMPLITSLFMDMMKPVRDLLVCLVSGVISILIETYYHGFAKGFGAFKWHQFFHFVVEPSPIPALELRKINLRVCRVKCNPCIMMFIRRPLSPLSNDLHVALPCVQQAYVFSW
jgi:hypothetical protein